ncbi:MAG: hypothetical protein ACFE96_13125 [Candidatus Hermodarchaeota archaeon]
MSHFVESDWFIKIIGSGKIVKQELNIRTGPVNGLNMHTPTMW